MERKAFTQREQIILATLVKEKGAAIESKKTDNTTLKLKNDAWEEITKHYNIQPEVNVKRSSQQLRKLWANLKQKKRKETTKLKYEMLATGGGLPEEKEADAVLAIVDDAAPYADVEVDNIWDSTAVFQNSTPVCVETHMDNVDSQDELEDHTYTALNVEETPAKKRKQMVRRENRFQIEEEGVLRVKKIKESIEQQNELHAIRMQTAMEELAAARARRKLDEAKLLDYKSKNALLKN